MTIVAAGCLKSKDKDKICEYDPCAVKAPAMEVQKVEDYLAEKAITDAIKDCSGLYYRILEEGSGTAPAVCSNVTIRYKGELVNGMVFDETKATDEPRTFLLMELISGWKNALPRIKPGGVIQLFIPPSLGYGSTLRRTPNGDIPANSVLIFEIQLLDVR